MCKCRRKCIPGECSCIELRMKCTEACESHDCENFWNKEADLEITELNEGDFDLGKESLKTFIDFLKSH